MSGDQHPSLVGTCGLGQSQNKCPKPNHLPVVGDAPKHPRPWALPGWVAWLPTGGYHEGRATGLMTKGHVPSRAAAGHSSDRFSKARACRDLCVLLPCLHPCLPQHPTRQGSESRARALWYLQPHQDQHHSSTQPVPDPWLGWGCLAPSPWALQCLCCGTWHEWHKAWQGAEIGTVPRSRRRSRETHAGTHRHTHAAQREPEGSCHPQVPPTRWGTQMLPAPTPPVSRHPGTEEIPGVLRSQMKLLTEDGRSAGSSSGLRRGHR